MSSLDVIGIPVSVEEVAKKGMETAGSSVSRLESAGRPVPGSGANGSPVSE